MFCFKLRSRFFPVTVVLATCTLACVSQDAWAIQMPMAGESAKKQTEDTDVMRVEWLKLNPTGSRAKFEMPAKPRYVERTLTPVKGRPPIKVRLYSATPAESSINFTLNYHDLSERPRGGDGIENTLEGVIRGTLANVSGQLLSKTEIVLKGAKGRQFAYGFVDNKDNKYIALSRTFLKGRRLYQLTAVKVVKDERDFDETVAARFLNSFEFAPPKSDLPPVPKAPPESKRSR